MIENKGFPTMMPRSAAAREIIAKPLPPKDGSSVHRFCGQLCGEPGRAGPQAAPVHAREHGAQHFSREIPLQINGLHDFDTAVTRVVAFSACAGAPVEFQSRAVARFPDD
jgi:hypothetical protein